MTCQLNKMKQLAQDLEIFHLQLAHNPSIIKAAKAGKFAMRPSECYSAASWNAQCSF